LLSNLLDGQLVKIGQILQNLLKTISTATASRELQQGIKMGLLKRSGDKRHCVGKHRIQDNRPSDVSWSWRGVSLALT